MPFHLNTAEEPCAPTELKPDSHSSAMLLPPQALSMCAIALLGAGQVLRPREYDPADPRAGDPLVRVQAVQILDSAALAIVAGALWLAVL